MLISTPMDQQSAGDTHKSQLPFLPMDLPHKRKPATTVNGTRVLSDPASARK